MNRRALRSGAGCSRTTRRRSRRSREPLLRGGASPPPATTLDELVARRSELLTRYQDASYAERYRAFVARVARARGSRRAPGSDALARAVARNYAKLLAYKDEYEVARLYTDGSFAAQLAREFEGDYTLQLHLSPQFLPAFLAPRDPETGHVRKWRIPTRAHLPVLPRDPAAPARLRGTPFDPFGWTRHRRWERRLIADYERTVAELLDGLAPESLPTAVEIASLPEHVRGFDDVKERQHEEARHEAEPSCSQPSGCGRRRLRPVQEEAMPRIIFSGANLLDGDKPARANSTVVVEGETIRSVGAAKVAAQPGDRVIDARRQDADAGADLVPLPRLVQQHHHPARAARRGEARELARARRREEPAGRRSTAASPASCPRARTRARSTRTSASRSRTG